MNDATILYSLVHSLLQIRVEFQALESKSGLRSIAMVFLSSISVHLSDPTYITLCTSTYCNILVYSAIYLGMPVHDELCGRLSFPLLLI